MKLKKLLATLLCVAALAGNITVLPASAVEATAFPDISDPAVAEAAELLHRLGVINGYDDGCYHPDDALNRAQFCRLAVDLRGEGSQAAAYERYTYFTDVKGDHWARGYINYASRITVSDTERLVSGVGDGSFQPDRAITQAEAVTMCLRLLGYSLADVGSAGTNWFDGYMSTACRLGLLEGIEENGTAVLDRGTAALLFRNLLYISPKSGGNTFFTELGGSVTQELILLGTDEKTGALRVRTEDGITTYQTDFVTVDEEMAGTRVTFVLDKNKKVIDVRSSERGTIRTVTLAAHEINYLTTAEGERLSMSTSALVYQGEEQTTYGKIYMELRAGTELKLSYDAEGKLEYLYFEPASAESYTTAVLRVDCVYENAYPGPNAPLTITVLGGTELTVLEQASEALTAFSVGDKLTLLLTADGKVAGVSKPDSTKPSTLVGLVTAITDGSDGEPATATVKPITALTDANGTEITLSGNISALSKRLENQLVTVSSDKSGYLTLTKVSGNSAEDDLNVAQRKLGDIVLSDRVALYERTLSSAPRQISWAQITVDTVPASKISYVGTDLNGNVDLIILNDVTGDGYTYGFLTSRKQKEISYGDGDLGSVTYYLYYAVMENSNGKTELRTLTDQEFSGTAAGMAANTNGRLGDTVTLSKLTAVSRSSFDMENMTVTIGGLVYPVSQTVECYNQLTGTWFGSGADALNAARAYSSTMTVYYDNVPSKGGKIRLVVVE